MASNKKDFVVKGGIVVNESTKIGADDDGNIEIKDHDNPSTMRKMVVQELMFQDEDGRTKKMAIDKTSGRIKTFDMNINTDTTTADKIDLGANNTGDLSEGSNLYYTVARADARVNAGFAAKSTSNLREGANLYYTDARVASYLSNNDYITDTSLTSTLSSYATQAYVTSAIADVIDTAPSTLDTLNELAAALGDDPNYATTTANLIGGKISYTTAETTAGEAAYLLSIGKNTSGGYQFIQSHGSQPLKINPLGNSVNIGAGLAVTNSLTVGTQITATGTAGHRLGRITIRDDSIENHQASGHIAMNFVGTSGGTSEFKNVNIYDGKGNVVTQIAGSTKTLTNHGLIHILSSSSGATAYQGGNGGLNIESSSRAALNILTPNNGDGYVFFADPQAGNAGYLGYEHSNARMVYKSETVHRFSSGSTHVGNIDYAGFDAQSGGFLINGVSVIDANKNASFNNTTIGGDLICSASSISSKLPGHYYHRNYSNGNIYAHYYGDDGFVGNTYFRFKNGDAFTALWHDYSNQQLNYDRTFAAANIKTSGSVTVGDGTASSYIMMSDVDEGGRYIHCNSNRIGFLNSGNGWGSWSEDDGSWATSGDVWVNHGSSGNNYLYLEKATGGDGHIIFRENASNKWQNTSIGDELRWYSYSLGGYVMSLTGDGNLILPRTIVAGRANNSTYGNLAAIQVASHGTGDQGAAIAIQQTTAEGDTIIFADYGPHVNWGISHENNANLIDFTAATTTGSVGASKTFKDGDGVDRVAHVKVRINLTNGETFVGGDLSVFGDLKMSGTDSYIWTPSSSTGFTGLWDAPNSRAVWRYQNNSGYLDIQRPAKFSAQLYPGNFGPATFSWGGSSNYPTLYSDHRDRWVMLCAPHIPYLLNGHRGYTGTSSGAVMLFENGVSGGDGYWTVGSSSSHPQNFVIKKDGLGPSIQVDNSGVTRINGKRTRTDIRKFAKQLSAGTSSATHIIARYGRNWWGLGFLKITVRSHYYGPSSDYRVYRVLGHTRVYHGGGPPTLELTENHGSTSACGVLSVVNWDSTNENADIQITLDAYRQVFVEIEYSGSVSASSTPGMASNSAHFFDFEEII